MLITVAIADDHAVIREGLKKILRDENDFEVIGEASNADELLSLAERKSFDVLVLDVNMPGRSGLDALEDVKRLRPHVKVLILSINPEDIVAIRSLKAGAMGYITKDNATQELVSAIRRVASGRKYISTYLADRLARLVSGETKDSPHEALSRREYEIFIMIAKGKSVTDIAADLHLTLSTVNTHRIRLLGKMDMKTNADLIQYAMRQGLI